MAAHALDIYCDILIIALMFRMIFSLFDPNGEGIILGFTAFLTEPILILGEKLLTLFKINNGGPFDLSVLVGYALLMIVRALLIPFLG
jgi:uncharacterized protein YggT (Ycf19 family)